MNTPNQYEARVERMRELFRHARYPEATLHNCRSDSIFAAWLAAGVSPRVLTACIHELRENEAHRPLIPGFPTARPIEKLELRVLDAALLAGRVNPNPSSSEKASSKTRARAYIASMRKLVAETP